MSYSINQNHEILLLKLGEIVLKGLNRRAFEDRLLGNIRRKMRHYGNFRVTIAQSTIYIESRESAFDEKDENDIDAAYAAAQKIFGVVKVARAIPCEKEIDAIIKTAETFLKDDFAKVKSFKVESKRADKQFPMTSIQISQEVGGVLAEKFPNVRVDVHHPELTVYVEIRERAAYVHAPAASGAGGLPVGMGGHALSLLSGGLDSPVASWMMARRGVELELAHFISPPYTSQQAQDKVVQLAHILSNYCGRLNVHFIPFTKIQEEIRRSCPEEYFTILMRRFMMRLSERLAKKTGAKTLITGESLGQVASQTMTALCVTEEAVTMPVLRPLIGMDKEDITQMARKIGTYETSILPYEDCCTVFTPRHPAIRPKLFDVQKVESALPVQALCDEAFEGIVREQIKNLS